MEDQIEHMKKLLKDVREKEELPKDCKEAIIYPIHKKGDKSVCHNYRGIVY
jgi:hypothetical protein